MIQNIILTLFIGFLLFSPSIINESRAQTSIQQTIEDAHRQFTGVTEGKNADYIPFLANVPSNLFGIVIVTYDGKIYKTGDTRYEFGIESISKAFVLAQAMQIVGPDYIEKNIGVGATGLPFNSIMAIELEGYKPVSPIVNAGAMATNSLIKGITKDEQFEKILGYLSDLAGRELKVIEELYKSEAATNQHNRAIAMLLQAYGHIWADPVDACDSYTKQCSVGITAEDLAYMGAVLANGGMHPVTKKRLVSAGNVPKVLAVMGMEGLYESTGSWMYRTGLPAKSGVGGGVVAVVPGRMAIAAFAPPLDAAGNSVKAQKAIEYIAEKLELSIYKNNSRR